MSEAAEVRQVPIEAGVPAGTPIRLVVEAEGGRCAFASGVAVAGGVTVGPVGAARAAWFGDRVEVTTEPVEACAGLPDAQVVAVPAPGTVVGLQFPVIATDLIGPFTLTPIGDGWFQIRSTGASGGTLVFSHAAEPPTVLELVTDPTAPQPPGTTVRVARGGVSVLTGVPSWVDLGPGAAIVGSDAYAAVLGRTPGTVTGLWRVGLGVPEPVRVEVGAGLSPRDDEIRVPAGGHKQVRPDRAVSAAWAADEDVARVELDGARLRIDGLAPGRTEVALLGQDGIYVLTVAVGR